MRDFISKNKQLLSVSLCIILGLGSFGFWFVRSLLHDKYVIAHTSNEDLIKTKTAELEHARKEKEELEASVDKYRNFATDAGSEVAKLQNSYANVTVSTDKATVQDIYKKMSAYFDDKESRQNWLAFQGDMGLKWSFKTTYSFPMNKINVVWYATSNDSNVFLGYAIATYDVVSKKFSNLNVVKGLKEGSNVVKADTDEYNKFLSSVFSEGE